MRRTVLFGVLTAAAIAGLTGCQQFAKTQDVRIPNPFYAAPERPLADVPVPVGFRYKETGSYVFDQNYRVAKLRWGGTPHVQDVCEFYKEQMPLNRWRFVRDGGVDERTLLFHNDREECRVVLDRKSGFTSIVVEIEPRKI